MPNYQVRLAPRAQSQIDEVTAWWRANRPAAANLVADELEAAVDRIASAPSSGTVYRQVVGMLVQQETKVSRRLG